MTLHFSVCCQAIYPSSLEVPDGMTREEAFEYAKHHLDEASIEGDLEWLSDSDELNDGDLDIPGVVYLEEEDEG